MSEAALPASSEVRLISRQAVSLFVGLIAVMGFSVIDTLAVGRHSDQALAALSVGASIYVSVFVALNGVLQALLPIWAELHGGGRPADIGRSVRQAMYLVVGLSALGMAVLCFPGPLMTLAEVPVEVQGSVREYLWLSAVLVAPNMCFRLYGTLNQSVGKPFLVTVVQIAAVALKLPLTFWFALGGWGLPAMGATGCMLATLVVTLLMLAFAFTMMRLHPIYEPMDLWHPLESPDLAQLREFLRLGLPVAANIFVEVTSFTMMALFLARQGVLALAAHQIATNFTAMLFMIPLSLGIATSARVSYWHGAGEPDRALAALGSGLRLTLSVAVAMALLTWGLRAPIGALYADKADVALLAGQLLGWVALFHLADAGQGFSGLVLRSFRITVRPFLIYSIALWGVGLMGGYVLAYTDLVSVRWHDTPQAFWVAGTVAVWLAAISLGLLLWHASRADAKSRQQHHET